MLWLSSTGNKSNVSLNITHGSTHGSLDLGWETMLNTVQAFWHIQLVHLTPSGRKRQICESHNSQKRDQSNLHCLARKIMLYWWNTFAHCCCQNTPCFTYSCHIEIQLLLDYGVHIIEGVYGLWPMLFVFNVCEFQHTATQHQLRLANYPSPVLTVISGVKTADVTDAANPLIHLVFGVSHQVEDTVNGLDVKYEAVLQVLLVECQPSVHLREQTTALSLTCHRSRQKGRMNV